MKKLIIIALALAFVLAMGSSAKADPVCAKISDGTIMTRADGVTIETGYDDFGYNYGAKRYSGRYCDADRDLGGDFCDVDLAIKWNDNYLDDEDCDGDGFLDRPTDIIGETYQGSGAWVTNHMTGTTLDSKGRARKWTYFVKIVAVPSDAYQSGGFWYSVEGIEIGPVIWDNFAIVQEVYNDPSVGAHGIQFKSPIGPGLGNLQ